MDGDYLISASNSIFNILSKTSEPTVHELSQAFRVGCSALMRLQEDGAFSRALQLLAKRKGTVEKDVDSIVNDIEHFTSGFLVIERKVMTAAGINEVTWGRLYEAARSVRADAASASLDEVELRNIVNELRISTCKIADELERGVKSMARKKSARKILSRVGLGVGGATIAFVNAGALAASLGLSTAGSVVSALVGGALLTKSIEGG